MTDTSPLPWTAGFLPAIKSRHYTDREEWIVVINALADEAQKFRPTPAQQKKSDRASHWNSIARKWEDPADHLIGWLTNGMPASSAEIVEAHRHVMSCIATVK